MNELIKVVLVEQMVPARVVLVENNHVALKGLIGGWLERHKFWEDNSLVLCNEDGKRCNEVPNRLITDDKHMPVMPLWGTFLICGTDGSELTSLPDQLQKKYLQKFRTPHGFYLNGEGNMTGICEEPMILGDD